MQLILSEGRIESKIWEEIPGLLLGISSSRIHPHVYRSILHMLPNLCRSLFLGGQQIGTVAENLISGNPCKFMNILYYPSCTSFSTPVSIHIVYMYCTVFWESIRLYPTGRSHRLYMKRYYLYM